MLVTMVNFSTKDQFRCSYIVPILISELKIMVCDKLFSNPLQYKAKQVSI